MYMCTATHAWQVIIGSIARDNWGRSKDQCRKKAQSELKDDLEK